MAKNVDSDILNKFVVLPENIRREMMEWFRSSKEVSIFITGKTGVGKSTLVNGLVGSKMAEEGDDLDPETMEVKSHIKECHCVKVTVWDSPGLQDGTSNEVQYLANMKEKCSGMDLCVYCVSLIETRIFKDCADIIAMKKLTETFGKKMWENSVFVLTFANLADNIDSAILEAEDAEKPELFKKKIEKWKETLIAALINDVGIDKEVADRIEVVPAGYATQPALLDRDHWLSPVWFAALYAMNPRAQPALLRLNAHRIVDNPKNIRKEDLQKFIHEQPVIFSERGALIGEKYGESEIGKAIGYSMGKDASDEIVEAHSVFARLAKLLGNAFMELIKAIIEATEK